MWQSSARPSPKNERLCRSGSVNKCCLLRYGTKEMKPLGVLAKTRWCATLALVRPATMCVARRALAGSHKNRAWFGSPPAREEPGTNVQSDGQQYKSTASQAAKTLTGCGPPIISSFQSWFGSVALIRTTAMGSCEWTRLADRGKRERPRCTPRFAATCVAAAFICFGTCLS